MYRATDCSPDTLLRHNLDRIKSTNLKCIAWLSFVYMCIYIHISEKTRSEKQRRKGKIQASGYRVPKNSKER